jgi:hypothetical protein
MNILNLNLEKPTKSVKCYYSKCMDTLIFNLKDVCTMNKVYKKDGKLFLDVILNNKSIRKITQIEKLIKKECLKYYKEWNNKDIERDLFYKRYVTIIENIVTQKETIEETHEEETGIFDYDTDSDGDDFTDTSSTKEEYYSTFELEVVDKKVKSTIVNYNKLKKSYKKIGRYDDISLVISFKGVKFGKTKFKPHFVIQKLKIHQKEDDIEDEFKNKCYIASDYENEAMDEGYLSYESDGEREYISKLIKKDIERRRNKTFIDYLSD